ncbi:ferrous iron transport protein B [Pelosinus fermentans]|uniref:ferrous iron transport protein B n=1 Tax=Pelosinus fermentans TaxID=365349 RepID=UPI001F304A86|nr:ferrous iron transport protein B [Pelosinus fermentans]
MVLVGSPNVGKSVIFNYLTGKYVAVSNYPGTTVDISRGYSKINGKAYEFIDTPGMYSLIPITEEERVSRMLLCQEKPDIVLHVIDAKNIRRMLHLTLQLIDMGFPVVLVVNLIDEAKKNGIFFKLECLSDILGIPVIATIATKGLGLGKIKEEVQQYSPGKIRFSLLYSPNIEQAIHSISAKIKGEYGLSRRMTALLLIQGDKILYALANHKERAFPEVLAEVNKLNSYYQYDMEYILAVERQRAIDRICDSVLEERKIYSRGVGETLSRLTREPVTGIPILCLVIFFGIYQFVGKFGAGFLVEYLDLNLFVPYINPLMEYYVYQYIPWDWLQSLIMGKYGFFTLGFRYAFIIILPIVSTFFFMFAILEDSGYLPRLAMLMDFIFKKIGLNGRAVIPFALGLGCGTMAVMVTRTLETRRERTLATFLLSLTIPCSAQLGVILALLSDSFLSLTIWGCYILLIFGIVGRLSGSLLPGNSSSFYMEIPPLRLPMLSNVLHKAFIRMWWYFIEILPIFIITSIVLWIGDRTGVLTYIIYSMQPVMSSLSLPIETAQPFLLGFFRRDYGAAGLYEMVTSHSLSKEQLLIASVTLTLFVPCIAQVAVMIKERGVFISIIMLCSIIFLAFMGGLLLSKILPILNLYL